MHSFHGRQQSALAESADRRAAFAASGIDQTLDGLLRTLKAIAPFATANADPSAGNNTHIHDALAGTGIVLVARNRQLQPLSADGSRSYALGPADQEAGNAALAQMAPQVSSIAAPGSNISGFNIWLPIDANVDGALLQVIVPNDFISQALSAFAQNGEWQISITDRDGKPIGDSRTANRGALEGRDGLVHSNLPQTAPPGPISLVESFAPASHFGWKISAGTQTAALQEQFQRNWMALLAVTFMIFTLTFGAAHAIAKATSEDFDHWRARIRANAANRESADRANPKLEALEAQTSIHAPENGGQQIQTRALTDARLRLALSASNMGVWQWDRQSGRVYLDDKFHELIKLPRHVKSLKGEELLMRFAHEDRRLVIQSIRGLFESGNSFACEVRLKRFDDEMRWFMLRGSTIVGQGQPTRANAIQGVIGFADDITDQKLSIERTNALLREVSHRSKNMLALVLAMARLTARQAGDVRTHLREFSLRVAGLSASQDLIVASNWTSVDLAELALAEIDAVGRIDSHRISVSGPSFLVTPPAAQTLGMIFAELILNAAQHGALSTEVGAVTLNWELQEQNLIEISWRESGGPPFNPNRRAGYSMTVVERFSEQGLKVSARFDNDPEGFRWTLIGPAANLGVKPPPHRG